MLGAVPDTPPPYEDLIVHLTRTTALTTREAARVVADVIGYLSESADTYIRRRHRELKARGLTNDQAFGMIRAELPTRRVTPPPFTARQLRRIIYG